MTDSAVYNLGNFRMEATSNKSSAMLSPFSSAPQSPALDHLPSEDSTNQIPRDMMSPLPNTGADGIVSPGELLEEDGELSPDQVHDARESFNHTEPMGLEANNVQSSAKSASSKISGDKELTVSINQDRAQSGRSSTNAPSISQSIIAPRQQQGRRSSFGLNFLSSITNTIRGNGASNNNSNHSLHQPNPPPPTSNHFMSNSPTIANLLNYTMSLTQDQPLVEESSEGNSGINSTASESDSENPQTNQIIQTSVVQLDGEVVQITSSSTPAVNTLPDAPLDSNGMDKDGFYSVRLTPLIDHSSSASALYFAPLIRKVKPNSKISIGRYTERNKAAAHAPQGSSAPIVFKSKVVSRTHALLQCNDDGQWFLKDCSSSSGTFLNHIRLSRASEELTLWPLLDGDIIQLGMDYRGGTEEFYRCVKMRCEFNKSWQRKVNQFNLEIHQKLKNMHITIDGVTGSDTKSTSKEELSECAICLLKIEPCQALFISPCSHSWHYKCIRPIIIKSYPQFYCPNCRSMCDLETDIEQEDDE